MAERTKFTITEVKEPRPVGQAEVLEFVAANGEGKRLRYGVWSKALYDYIKKGAVVDVEVEVKGSDKTDPNGDHYVSR